MRTSLAVFLAGFLAGLCAVVAYGCALKQSQVQQAAPPPPVVNPEAPVSTANQQAWLAAAVQGFTGISHQSSMSITLAVLLGIFVIEHWAIFVVLCYLFRYVVKLSHQRAMARQCGQIAG